MNLKYFFPTCFLIRGMVWNTVGNIFCEYFRTKTKTFNMNFEVVLMSPGGRGLGPLYTAGSREGGNQTYTNVEGEQLPPLPGPPYK